MSACCPRCSPCPSNSHSYKHLHPLQSCRVPWIPVARCAHAPGETSCHLCGRRGLRLAVRGHGARHQASHYQRSCRESSRRHCRALQARPTHRAVRLLPGQLLRAGGRPQRPGVRRLAGEVHPSGVRSAGAAQPPREPRARGERRFHGQSGHFPAAAVGHHLPAAFRDRNSSPRAGGSPLRRCRAGRLGESSSPTSTTP